MNGLARQSADIAVGPQIGANQSWVTIDGHLWMVLGDVNAPHGLPPHVPGPDAMAQGSNWVTIDCIPACREGHIAGCGHPTTGSEWASLDQ